MPVADGSYDVVICLAVLEHVGKPWVAVSEMKRVLKPGGMLLAYVPFLSPYHAMPGYYGDYFRYTEDGIRSLLEGWTDVKVSGVRGPIETIAHLLPGHLASSFCILVRREGCEMVGWSTSLLRETGIGVFCYGTRRSCHRTRRGLNFPASTILSS